MDYQQFRALRDRWVVELDPVRLDCMNPARALASLAPLPEAEPTTALAALRAWLGHFAPTADVGLAMATTGVRPALRAVFERLATVGYELWLPEDVYPAYWQLASEAGLNCQPLATMPSPDLSTLRRANHRAALLLPEPLAPLGRYLTERELHCVRAWLEGHAARRVIFDTVYHFNNILSPAVRSCWETGQTYVVHSLAKGWLLPDTLGVALASTAMVEAQHISAAPPSPEAAGQAEQALTRHPELPQHVEAACRRRWAALADRIQEAVPSWSPPATGYFSVLSVPFRELLERHRLLAVPASVFGSHRADLSIISCLYYPTEGV